VSVKELNIAFVVKDHHGPIFRELIELLTECLQSAGVSTSCTINAVMPDRLNVFVGATMFLPPELMAKFQKLPYGYVVFQLEALHDSHGFSSWRPAYFEFLRGAKQVWDYSAQNGGYLARLGIADVRYIPVGYSRQLVRIAQRDQRDIDVMFYGSVTARRRQILTELQHSDLKVEVLFGKYGPERDDFLARAKIQLNIHQFDTNQLEQLRLSYLLNNRCFVISEVCDQNPYGDGVVFCEYKDVVSVCKHYLQPGMEAERERIARLGCESLKRVPMEASIRDAVKDLAVSEAVPAMSDLDGGGLSSKEMSWMTSQEVPRNAPCPCGSGKRFKHCHGLPTQLPPVS
jgi:hypothetical protein